MIACSNNSYMLVPQILILLVSENQFAEHYNKEEL